MKRNTSQPLLPLRKEKRDDTAYDLYPSFHLLDGSIQNGYETLAEELILKKKVILDGYIGVDWEEVIGSLTSLLEKKRCNVATFNIADFLMPEAEILSLVRPFLGGDDPIFGYRTDLELLDYFKKEKLYNLEWDQNADLNIIYGTGAALTLMDGFLVYFDVPKNELQYRMRARDITNLGISFPKDAKPMYKHLYFVDWVVLNREKKRLLPHMDIVVDQQRPKEPTWIKGEVLRKALNRMSKSYFRVRPWFEPGVWGGQWMKDQFRDLNQNVPNYAWSFEMIVPENGLLFESDETLLEVSFDMLMYQEKENILGRAVKRFGDEFPIRFDFLDTFKGGNLSVQCHPSPEYIKQEFGENFTQDETYYILDAKQGAQVYLGFQEGVDQHEFKQALENSYNTKETLEVNRFVQKFPSKKHDLFLIPHGTIHCSGTNNLVLEISATPYIFTFKMYDWQRMDMDGNPRPLNIERAIQNLDFEKKGGYVSENLISKPAIVETGSDWEKIHLPTHRLHFYDIYRYDFETTVDLITKGQCHVLMLVEGEALELKGGDIPPQKFHFAETFAVPAATESYTLINRGRKKAKVIVSFVKDEAC
ncbi:class I mannose-6-phosphate isomerase [Ulvibacterium marinum]|uniref:class I mannose-6-phosphate isomerase n=1 Tax=Ulvibacterium marinum TaxID=2419782 RepID=UPI0024941D99|nr:class I mannose-6-phosphate isomerase [Ulvibacterium marinum]